MERTIQTCSREYRQAALDLVERVFTEHENAAEGKIVRSLVEEIRAKEFYVPELELIAVNGAGEIVGYAMFSRFHLEGRYSDELLILTPVAVRTEFQRQHISRDLIEFGFQRARDLGYRAVLVEGNPRNYRARGFQTAADFGIVASPNIHLPHVECLMAKELVPGALGAIHGIVDYGCYKALS